MRSIDKKSVKNEAIMNCEIEYTKCFSTVYEDENILRFRDDMIKDMYSHNYTYFKRPYKELKLRSLIEEEIAVRKAEQSDFCNILTNSSVNYATLTYVKYESQMSINGFYQFDLKQMDRLKQLESVEVKRIDDVDRIEDILVCDLDADEARHGKDFCIRRCYRRGQVYIKDQGVDAYVAYVDGQIVGCCNLFIHDGIAKIEDFSVIERHQRKGYGTSILKALISIALTSDCHTVYLVTDESDTAKEMYVKLGFSKIGETTGIMFKLK